MKRTQPWISTYIAPPQCSAAAYTIGVSLTAHAWGYYTSAEPYTPGDDDDDQPDLFEEEPLAWFDVPKRSVPLLLTNVYVESPLLLTADMEIVGDLSDRVNRWLGVYRV